MGMGFKREGREGEDAEAIEKLFTPEFRNRLDAIIGFASLKPDVIAKIVDKYIIELENQLEDRGVEIQLMDDVRQWLARKGHDTLFGARPLSRIIQEYLKKLLAEELLFGKLTN